MRSVTETNEERNSVEVEVNAKGEVKSTVKLYFEGDELESIRRAVEMNLYARNHYFTTKNEWATKEEVVA